MYGEKMMTIIELDKYLNLNISNKIRLGFLVFIFLKMNFSSGLVIVKKTLHILSLSNMENALSMDILFFLKFPSE